MTKKKKVIKCLADNSWICSPKCSQFHSNLSGGFLGCFSVVRLQSSVRAISGPPSGHKTGVVPLCVYITTNGPSMICLRKAARPFLALLIFENEKAYNY